MIKNFNYQGSRWNHIDREKNHDMEKAGYVLISRPVSISIMKKQHGQMATSISAKPENLPASVRSLAQSILSRDTHYCSSCKEYFTRDMIDPCDIPF